MSDQIRISLSSVDADRVVETLRAAGGDHVSRGRGGSGLGYRDGVFYRISVDEFAQDDTPFQDEVAFRAYLAAKDFATSRYLRTVVRRLGGHPSVDAGDAEAIGHGLSRQAGVAIKPPLPWRGVVYEVLCDAGETWARLTPDGHTRPVWLHLSADVYVDLQAQCLEGRGLVGRTVLVSGHLRPDTPGPGDVTIRPWSEVGLPDVTLL